MRDVYFEGRNDTNKGQIYFRNKTACEKFSIYYYHPEANGVTKKMVYRLCNPAVRNLSNLSFAEGYKLHQTARPLEGGNLFSVHNAGGEKFVIIGENVQFLENWIRANKHSQTPEKVFYTEDPFTDRYARILGVRPANIIVVPNLTHHIDLQMCYIGFGIFLIHSFQETIKYFPSFVTPYHPIPEDYEQKVDFIIQLLDRHGFVARKFCGNLHYTRTMLEDGSFYRLNHQAIYNWEMLASTVVNGFDVYSAYKNQHYFVTLDSPIQAHKDYFINLINEINNETIIPRYQKKLELYFVNASSFCGDKSPAVTVKFCNEYYGAVRCQVNFLDTDSIEQLKSIVTWA